MQVRSEQQRQFLLEAVKHAMVPGHLIDLAYEAKADLLNAAVETASEVIYDESGLGSGAGGGQMVG